ncbi:hypothetical protein DCS32_10505 [Dokdonia sp. Dokd-P16]|uniref:hypothetical protein n=1 Tax=Dokdonia sp. Dokd-P16 TaxID=2173169 RepID=UPI000D545B0E|nr:hypothetical protein [Dokdonia sp. Dokd-P16]AWH74570.1 hypothetical protein DCS32_10505 [Dokdonia sp. Dokd-P16]
MNRKELEIATEDVFKKICNSFGFFRINGIGGFKKITDKHIFSITSAQLRTQGIYDNQFEYSIGGNCTILEIENVWQDLYYLTRPESEFTNQLKEVVPFTYNVDYKKEELKEMFPNNVRDTGWLYFKITKEGIANFEKVITHIIQELLIPQLSYPISIAELDKNVNSQIELKKLDSYLISKNGFIYRRIILAKLNNNPLFEQICNFQRLGFKQYEEISNQKGYEHFKNIPNIFEKVYERLNNNTIANS